MTEDEYETTMEARHVASRMHYQEGRSLFFCRHCLANISIADNLWEKFSKQHKYLGYLEQWGNCCPAPEWLFITDIFWGSPKVDPKTVKNFKDVIKPEYYIQVVCEML